MKNLFLIQFEQLRRGSIYFRSLKGRNLTSITLYATTRCNSRCKICNIWKKTKRENISLQAIKNILKKENPHTQYFLSGGEFILHPQHEKILQLFKNKNYILLSNGVMSKRLVNLVKKYQTKRVVLSFDGVGKTYEKVRGINNFENLHQLVHQLKKICLVSLNFTINPLNNEKKEVLKADQFAKEHGVYLSFGIYNNPDFFDTSLPKMKIPDLNGLRGYPLGKYLSLYNQWLEGKIQLPCLGIRNNCMVLPNGDVSLCQGKNIILGNLNKQTLREIWNSSKTHQKQDEFLFCNDCWLLCQKPMDIVAWDLIKHLPQKTIPEMFSKFFSETKQN